jgi:hypothetical protein
VGVYLINREGVYVERERETDRKTETEWKNIKTQAEF